MLMNDIINYVFCTYLYCSIYYSITYTTVKTHSKKNTYGFDRKISRTLILLKKSSIKPWSKRFSISEFLWRFSRKKKCTSKQFKFPPPDAGMLIHCLTQLLVFRPVHMPRPIPGFIKLWPPFPYEFLGLKIPSQRMTNWIRK